MQNYKFFDLYQIFCKKSTFPGGNTLVLKCLQEKVCPAWMKQPLQCALDWAPSWHGRSAQDRGSMGVCRASPGIFWKQTWAMARSCWLPPCYRESSPGMEKEKPVREIQQLNWIFRISIFVIQGTAWSLCSDTVACIFENNMMKARVKEMCLK